MFHHFVLTTKTTQPCLQVFLVNCSIIWLHTWHHFSHIAKSFQIWSTIYLVMMNYLWDFSQSEMEKYFEWIMIIVIGTKPNFPSPVKHYNFTPDLPNLPLIWTNLLFLKWFEKSGLRLDKKHCDTYVISQFCDMLVNLINTVKGLNPGVISKGWVWSSGWT